MEEMTDSETMIAWLWVIEAMASFKEVSLSLLRDLVQAAPDMPCELAKNAKERTALRCLEELCAHQSRWRASEVPSSSDWDSKVGFKFSESCENVLQLILQKTPECDLKAGGPELAKWDILPFISHKKAHLPKMALDKLRDSIIDGTHPYADFLRGKSGLGLASQDGEVRMNDENRNSVISEPNLTRSDVGNKRVEASSNPPIIENKNDNQSEGNQQNGEILPSKRNRADYSDEDKTGQAENCDVNVKKAKLCIPSDNQSTEPKSVPFCENELREEDSLRNVSVMSNECDLVRSEMGGGDENTVSKRPRDGDNDELKEDEPETHLNADVTIQDTPTSEPEAKGSKEASENCAERKPTSSAKENTDECCEEEVLNNSDEYGNDEITDVAKKKHEFLSSQLMDSLDSIAAYSEKNLCMKCNKAGQALVCSNNCQLVVHEKCIDSSAVFDDTGNFYCPFCAYSIAITEYLDAKKRYFLSRKEVSSFICKGSVEHQLKKSPGRLKKKKKHHKGSSKDDSFLRKNLEDVHLEERGRNEDNDCDRQEAATETKGKESDMPRKSDGLLSEANTEVNHVNAGKKDLEKNQDIDSHKQLAQEFSISSEGDDDESNTSNYFIRVRDKETKYRSKTFPGIPQSRRRKLPWTAEEEQKLKEDVEMFSGEKKIPWKKVMETGAAVYLDGRTPMDLKDKWRNMCKFSK